MFENEKITEIENERKGEQNSVRGRKMFFF